MAQTANAYANWNSIPTGDGWNYLQHALSSAYLVKKKYEKFFLKLFCLTVFSIYDSKQTNANTNSLYKGPTSPNGLDIQKFQINGNTVINKASNRCLETDANSSLYAVTCNGSKGQTWNIV
jgi:hypothetical protein